MENKERDFSEIVEMPSDFGKAEEAPVVENTPPQDAAPAEQPEANSGQPRTPDGKFASKEAKSPEEPQGEKPQASAPPAAAPEPQPKQPDPGFVPIAALLDTRDKANTYKRQLDEMQAKLAELERQRNEQPPIDPYTDFDGALNQRVEVALTPLQKANAELLNRVIIAEATATHGKEAVENIRKALKEAAENNDPDLQWLSVQMDRSPDPIGTAIRWHQQKSFDPEAEKAKIREQLLAELASKQPQNTPPAAPETPPSMAALAQGGSGTKEQTVSIDGKFNTMFNR